MIDNTIIDNNKRLIKPLFLVPQKWQLDNVKKLDAEMKYALNREAAQKSEAIAVDRDRLVKRCKCPTDPKKLNKLNFAELHAHNYKEQKTKAKKKIFEKRAVDNAFLASIKKYHESVLHTCPEPISLPSRKKTRLQDVLPLAPKNTIANDTKTCVRMFAQDWSGKYKFNLVTGALGAKVEPPVMSGERVTTELTKNASRNILESGAYMSATRAGYSTFLTLTFNDEIRQDLESLKVVNRNVFSKKRYRNRKGESWKIECYSGVPFDLGDTEHVKNATRYSNAVESSGAFTPVSFEPKTTIGKEVSRFFDGAQKIYQRGFVPESVTETREYPWGNVKCEQHNSEKIKPAYVMYCPDVVTKKTPSGEIPYGFENALDFEKYNPRKHTDSDYLTNNAVFGSRDIPPPLDYMWVAEQPDNKDGEKNPHVHILMRWRVKPELFQSWASRLEKLWGHGFAKLEKIKNPAAAGNYILKAVGYLTKGNDSGQGKIKGNRYGISASARAPGFECIGEFYADNFLAILGELREKLERKKALANSKINSIINGKSWRAKKINTLRNVNEKLYKENPTLKYKPHLKHDLNKEIQSRNAYIDKLIEQLKNSDDDVINQQNYINQLPFINEYAIGGMNEKQAADFLGWAMRERFWNAEIKENRFSKWSELKENTIKAVTESRRQFKTCGWLLETHYLSMQWADNDSNYEIVDSREQYYHIDENGCEWERVA